MDLIIGAGISGIAYAGFTGNDYFIFEAVNEIGGYCKTIKKDGFTWDYSGHFFHFQHEWLKEYVYENMEREKIFLCKKHAQIKYKDKYIDFPFQKNIHQLEKQEFIDCLYDLFAISEFTYTTFKQMLYVKFGKSIADKFLIPYNEKLYACDLDVLDVDAMGRFFPYVNKEEIILNFKKNDNSTYNDYFSYPKGGAIEYVNSLFKRVDKSRVFLNERIVSIDVDSKMVKTNLRELQYDNLISTMPFPKLLDICDIEYDKNIYSWNKVMVLNLGFDKKGDDRINNWVYFPDKEISFYRVGYYDNIFNDDRMSLYVELGFDKDQKNIDINNYMLIVLDDLKKSKIMTNQKLIAHHHVLMDPGYCHITKSSIQDVVLKNQELSKACIYTTGRYGSWTYSSMEDNILEAKILSDKLSR